jgi:ATP-dependent helicase/DNAse subunit B
MWGLICGALDTLVEVSGELEADIESFVGQLKICFGASELSRIPAHVDEVTVGSADMLRLYGKKHIYLMGVNAGEFPSSVSDSSYFTDGDKAALLRAGLDIAPELEERGARELYVFTRALTYARETLTISYSLKDTRYKSRERAEAVGRILRLFDGELKEKRVSELSAYDKLWSGSLL